MGSQIKNLRLNLCYEFLLPTNFNPDLQAKGPTLCATMGTVMHLVFLLSGCLVDGPLDAPVALLDSADCEAAAARASGAVSEGGGWLALHQLNGGLKRSHFVRSAPPFFARLHLHLWVALVRANTSACPRRRWSG